MHQRHRACSPTNCRKMKSCIQGASPDTDAIANKSVCCNSTRKCSTNKSLWLMTASTTTQSPCGAARPAPTTWRPCNWQAYSFRLAARKAPNRSAQGLATEASGIWSSCSSARRNLRSISSVHEELADRAATYAHDAESGHQSTNRKPTSCRVGHWRPAARK